MNPAELASLLVGLEDRIRDAADGFVSTTTALQEVVRCVDDTVHAALTVTADHPLPQAGADDMTGHRLETALRAALGTRPPGTVRHVVGTGGAAADPWSHFDVVADSAGVHSLVVQPVWLPNALHPDTSCTLFFRGAGRADSISGGVLLAVAAALAETLGLGFDDSPPDRLFDSLRDHREIGIATGVVMARCGVDREVAHALLRLSSQLTRQPLPVVATYTADRLDLDPRLHTVAARCTDAPGPTRSAPVGS